MSIMEVTMWPLTFPVRRSCREVPDEVVFTEAAKHVAGDQIGVGLFTPRAVMQ